MKSYSSATKGLVADQNKLNNAIIKQEQAKAEALEK
jgi:hypothetical protein